MADVKSLEHPTLKVPYEILNKKFRIAQKHLDREVSHVTASIGEVEKLLGEEAGDTVDRATLSQKLDTIKDQLRQMKAKGGEILMNEVEVADSIKKRCQHLRRGCDEAGEGAEVKQWRKTRLDRMMVEYLLRQGYYDTALQLADTAGVAHLSNTEVFLTAREVEESLGRGELAACLAWCHDNKSRLRKLKSSLEFQVRLQEFLELVKAGSKLEAVRHAKKFLCTETELEHLSIVQQAMGLLAFPPSTMIQPYKDLLDKARWQSLIEQFRHENFRLHQLSSQCMFTVALQSGLAALKTPQCYKHNFVLSGLPSLGSLPESRSLPLPLPVTAGTMTEKNPECPVCEPHLNTLAHTLPFAHCSQSRLVCTISGAALNENNQPMMLPNGHVYGERALEAQARQNEGQVICPRTKEIYSFKDAEKVYIM